MSHPVSRALGALALAAGALLALPAYAQAPSCPVKLGGILPLTGSMAPITKKIAQAAELGIEHINQGGGVKGCPVQFILRDDQGQPTVGVDAAKFLVEVERVAAFTGTISSGVTGPIITSVTAPSASATTKAPVSPGRRPITRSPDAVCSAQTTVRPS